MVVGSRWRGANTALGLNVLQLPGVLERRLPHTHRAWLTVEYAEE
ncbi:hypothetical protein [Paraburkholderia madseniana]|nr:hypothetical protein [Paraburkholderia madseniana]